MIPGHGQLKEFVCLFVSKLKVLICKNCMLFMSSQHSCGKIRTDHSASQFEGITWPLGFQLRSPGSTDALVDL